MRSQWLCRQSGRRDKAEPNSEREHLVDFFCQRSFQVAKVAWHMVEGRVICGACTINDVSLFIVIRADNVL